VKEATPTDPHTRDPPRVKGALVKIEVQGHLFEALIDSGCEVDALSERAARICGLQILSLNNKLELKFADGRREGRIGKVEKIETFLMGQTDKYSMERDFYVGPIHQDVILGMPWITAWQAIVTQSSNLVDVTLPADGRRVNLPTRLHEGGTSEISGTAPLNCLEDDSEIREEVEVQGAAIIFAAKAKGDRALDDPIQLTAEEQKRWGKLRTKYSEVLNNMELPAGRPPAARSSHRIELKPGAEPTYAPRYRRPPIMEAEIERQVQLLMDKGKLQESTSSFAANPVLVKRKDGRWRMCINYKPLNDITIKQKFPMPRVDELLDRLQGAAVFSSLDFTDAFLQIELAPEDRHKTAFHTHTRKVEFVCMPFGLTNAPAELQRQVNRDFAGPISEGWLIVYMDDVLIFSRSIEEHMIHLERVLKLIKEKQWYLKATKCSLFMSRLSFLGYRVSIKGAEPEAAKVEALKEWPLPLYTVKKVQSFYGLASYYRSFIPGFAQITAPLTRLFRKDVEFVWGEEQAKAAATIIAKLTSEPILALPNFKLPFYLTTDASDYAVGAVLSQKLPGAIKHNIISCHSHCFSAAEQKYPVREKEFYAVHWGVKKCKHYLYGQRFIIQTDHQSLVHATKSFKDFDNARVTRWLAYLAAYDYEIVYIKGVTNVVADALSRRPTTSDVQVSSVVSDVDSQFLAKIKKAYSLDSFSRDVIARLQSGQRIKKLRYALADDVLWACRAKGTRLLYVPTPLRKEVLMLCHDHVMSGHTGVHNTYEKIKRQFWWPLLQNDVKEYVLSCPECQQYKPRNCLKYGLLQSLPVPERIWTDISMDYIVALPEINGYDSILVIVDRMSKYAHFIPCHCTITAQGTANLFINNIWKLHGAPRSIVSDRDPRFMSEFWQSFMSRLGVQLCPTTANHPEADGQTERTNRTLIQFLRIYAGNNPITWIDFLPCAEFVYNTTVHSSTGCTPASLVYKDSPLKDPQLDILVERQRDPTSVVNFADQLADARKCMLKAQEQQAKTYNKKRHHVVFEPGDLVLVSRDALRCTWNAEEPKKFAQKWLGPFAIKSKINALAYLVDLPKTYRNHPTINIGFLKKFISSANYARTLSKGQQKKPLTSCFKGGLDVLQVREVTRRNRKKREYQVKFEDEKDLQWIQEERLKEIIGESDLKSIINSLNQD